MARYKLNVVLSQAQSKNPIKRALEESIVAALLIESGLEVSVIPHLYDLDAEHTGRLFLNSVRGDMVVLSWLYPRAAYWLLDRDGVHGHYGENLIKPQEHDEDEEIEQEPTKGIGSVKVMDRHIYCLDLRDSDKHDVYVNEIRRILAECKARAETRGQEQAAAKSAPLISLGIRLTGNTNTHSPPTENVDPAKSFTPEELLKQPGRRWYPVIDYSRCTNCMECLDFCLFGVYNADSLERIYVDNQDNCRKGCPACSRVCPEQAIMFPEYKTPAIAGAPVGGIESLKIDLSRLFGGQTKDAVAMAAQERDRELVAVGRDAVGLAVGIPKRQSQTVQGPKDDLDKLVDSLDI